MRNVAPFSFLTTGFSELRKLFCRIFGRIHKKKYGISKENVKIANGNGKINAQQGKTLKLRVLHKK